MSLSNPDKKFGTIFMGPTENRESTLEKLLNGAVQREVWTKTTEEEYMERVKQKAIVKVKSLLAKAEERSHAMLVNAAHQAELMHKEAEQLKKEAQAELEQAQNIRAQAEQQKNSAQNEGYTAGIGQAQIMLNQARNEIAQATAVILLAIHQQCITIFDSWRKDLSELLLEAVEKSTGYVIDNDRAAILQTLLEQSTHALLDKREYSICVHPNDAGIMTELLEEAHKNSPDSMRWSLKTDTNLDEGSLVIESPSGLVSNTRQTRENIVADILQHLTLPMSNGDQIAFDSITQTLIEEAQKVGLPLSGEAPAREDLLLDMNPPAEYAPPPVVPSPLPEENMILQDDPIQSEAEQLVESELADFTLEDESNIPLPFQDAIHDLPDSFAEELGEPEQMEQQAEEIIEALDEVVPHETVPNEVVPEEVKEIPIEEDISFTEPVSDNIIADETVADKTSHENFDNTNATLEYSPELADELLAEMGFSDEKEKPSTAQ